MDKVVYAFVYYITVPVYLKLGVLVGHPGIKAFVSHGGLHSVLEAVYHAAPMVTLPVFCDQAANSFKAAQDGYALALEIRDLNSGNFLAAINKVISDRR